MTISPAPKISTLTLAIALSAFSFNSQAVDITEFTTDFENEGAITGNVTHIYGLALDGWKVFGNVYDADANDNLLFAPDANGVDQPIVVKEYGEFTAENGSAPTGQSRFAELACGQAGANQGAQYLNVFGDYENYQDRPELDINGDPTGETNYIEALTFIEFDLTSVISSEIASDPSAHPPRAFEFTFDAKRPAVPDGIANNPCGIPVDTENGEEQPGVSLIERAAGVDRVETSTDENGNEVITTTPPGTAGAFMKILDTNNDYAVIDKVEVDTTNISRDTWNTFTIRIPITEAHLFDSTVQDAQPNVIQFGFRAVEINYGNTGVYYDNVSFKIADNPPPVDPTVIIPIPPLALLGLAFALMAVGRVSVIRSKICQAETIINDFLTPKNNSNFEF